MLEVGVIVWCRFESALADVMQGILDYMDDLSPQQIRRVFHLLSKLAFGHQQGSHIQVHRHTAFCVDLLKWLFPS